MRMRLSIFLAILMLVLPYQHVYALALSDIELNSSLDQILNARVLLLGINKDELGSLQVNIDEDKDLAATQSSVKLSPTIKQNENGYYISITSQNVIKEPILKFWLDLNWSKGHLIREYSLLLDPQ